MRHIERRLGFTLVGTLAFALMSGCGHESNDDIERTTGRVSLSRQAVLDLGFSDSEEGVIIAGELLPEGLPPKTPGSTAGPASLTEWGPAALCRGYYVSPPSLRYAGQTYFPARVLTSAEGLGPRRLGLSVSRSVSSEFSASVGISVGAVSAGVGYSIGTSSSVEAYSEIDVPSGRLLRLEAYAKYDKHTFQIWNDSCVPGTDSYVGDGQSFRPTGGVIFVTRVIR